MRRAKIDAGLEENVNFVYMSTKFTYPLRKIKGSTHQNPFIVFVTDHFDGRVDPF